MTKAEFIVTVKAAQRRNLRRVYAATATGIILVLPLVVLVLTNLITQRTFKVGLVLYSIASATAAIFILRRYGNRDVPCPHHIVKSRYGRRPGQTRYWPANAVCIVDIQ
jgi:hypothetical protein